MSWEFMRTDKLALGDTVMQQVDGSLPQPFSTCIVVKVTEDSVTLFRPYGVTADFSYTGGVIPYTGVEQYTVERDRSIMWTVFSHKELR